MKFVSFCCIEIVGMMRINFISEYNQLFQFIHKAMHMRMLEWCISMIQYWEEENVPARMLT